MKNLLHEKSCSYHYLQQGFRIICEFQFSILNLSFCSLTAVKSPKQITCSLLSHDLQHSQPFFFWLEKMLNHWLIFQAKRQSGCKFPTSCGSSLLPQSNQMAVLTSFLIRRERTLFLSSTLLTFPSFFVTKELLPTPGTSSSTKKISLIQGKLGLPEATQSQHSAKRLDWMTINYSHSLPSAMMIHSLFRSSSL